MEVSLEPLYAAANIFPSMEHVVETNSESGPSSDRMVSTGPPVWRFQLRSFPSEIPVKKWPSEEKLRPATVWEWCGRSRVLSRLRVTASSISTAPPLTIEMNLRHGDHATTGWNSSLSMVTTTGSHDIGNPHTTLTNGRAY